MTDFRVNGLVIKDESKGEYDKMLTILTEKYGKLFVMGKGVKSVRSRHMAATQLFSYSSFNLRKKGNYYYITDSDLIESYYEIRNDVQKYALSAFVCEVMYEISREGIEEAALLKLSLNTLYAIAKDIRPAEIIRAAFELRVAAECGFTPDISACRCCGVTSADMVCLDIMDGSIICEQCRKKEPQASSVDSFAALGIPRPIALISLSVLAAMRYVMFSKSERFLAFSLDPIEHQMFFDVSEKYLLNHLERGFYTLDFYKSLI